MGPLERRIIRLEKAVSRRRPRYVGKGYTPQEWAKFHSLFAELVKGYDPADYDWTFLEKYRKTTTQA